jgi:hypothetical protein
MSWAAPTRSGVTRSVTPSSCGRVPSVPPWSNGRGRRASPWCGPGGITAHIPLAMVLTVGTVWLAAWAFSPPTA